MRSKLGLLVLGVAAFAAGCGGDSVDSQEGDFTSSVATLLNFDFDGEVVTTQGASATGAIRGQLLFSVGQLNGENSISRLNAAQLTNVVTANLAGGLQRVRYHARLPVAWGSKVNLPKSYVVRLPKRADSAGLAAFQSQYAGVCADPEGHTLTAGNIWFYYRPALAGCSPAAGDVTVSTATVTVSSLNKSDKYPEYHRVWEDGALDVVAVFGKYEKGAVADDDAGIAAYNAFVSAVLARYPGAATTPSSIGSVPGAAHPDVTIDITLDDGRPMSVVALLVDEVASAPASFDARFGEVTPGADLVIYNGHAGLGANVRALTPKAKFFPGKYQLFFLNGCDTFAYEDDTLVKTHAALNADDPSGTKYLDVMRNAMPAYFSSMPDASMALIDALANAATPKLYADVFKGIDDAQVVVVTGEEDNTYTPAYNPANRWTGFVASDTVTYKQTHTYATATLPAGKYAFTMTPELGAPGGDADLYLKAGSAPGVDKAFKCPSYKFNSNEKCTVTLAAPAKIFMETIGDKQAVPSSYLVRGFQLVP